MFGQRFTHINALRLKEGVGHTAANDKVVDFFDEITEQLQLARHFRATNDGNDRTLGRAQGGF